MLLKIRVLLLEFLDQLISRIWCDLSYVLELTSSKVEHDFLAAARDCKCTNFAVNALDLFSLAAACIPSTSKALQCFPCTELCRFTCLNLEKGNVASKAHVLLVFG